MSSAALNLVLNAVDSTVASVVISIVVSIVVSIVINIVINTLVSAVVTIVVRLWSLTLQRLQTLSSGDVPHFDGGVGVAGHQDVVLQLHATGQ